MIKIKQARCRRANRKVTQSPPKCQCNPSRKVLLGVCWDPKRSYFQWKGHRLSPDEPCAAPPPALGPCHIMGGTGCHALGLGERAQGAERGRAPLPQYAPCTAARIPAGPDGAGPV